MTRREFLCHGLVAQIGQTAARNNFTLRLLLIEDDRKTAAQECGAIVFRVADTGEGIPPAHLPRIFDRFHRVDKARAGGGSGLGLAIVRTLVEAQGGTVSTASELGKGTTFTCRFPD